MTTDQNAKGRVAVITGGSSGPRSRSADDTYGVHEPRPAVRRTPVLVIILVSYTTIVLDISIVITALPKIHYALGFFLHRPVLGAERVTARTRNLGRNIECRIPRDIPLNLRIERQSKVEMQRLEVPGLRAVERWDDKVTK